MHNRTEQDYPISLIKVRTVQGQVMNRTKQKYYFGNLRQPERV